MGRVVQVFPGADGKVRSAKLMRSDRTEGIYPISKLYPLELTLTSNPKIESPTDEIPSDPPRRPERQAALQCKQKLRKMSN